MTTKNIWNPGSGPKIHGTRVIIRDCTICRAWQREREKQTNKQRFRKQNNFARASHFFVHFFAIFARLRREIRSRPCVFVLRSPCFFLQVLPVVNRARKAVIYIAAGVQVQRRIQGEGWGCPPSPFGKFSNFLSGYPCQTLFHTKNNIISYNKSPSPIDHYKKTVAIPLLDSLIIQMQDRLSDEDRRARALSRAIDHSKKGIAAGWWSRMHAVLGERPSISQSLGNEVRRWKTIWQSTDILRASKQPFISIWCLLWRCFSEHLSPSSHCLHPTDHKRRSWALVSLMMKWIKTCSWSTVPEEQFSDLAVIATRYSERFEVEVDEICQQAFVMAHPRRLFQASLFD